MEEWKIRCRTVENNFVADDSLVPAEWERQYFPSAWGYNLIKISKYLLNYWVIVFELDKVELVVICFQRQKIKWQITPFAFPCNLRIFSKSELSYAINPTCLDSQAHRYTELFVKLTVCGIHRCELTIVFPSADWRESAATACTGLHLWQWRDYATGLGSGTAFVQHLLTKREKQAAHSASDSLTVSFPSRCGCFLSAL